MLIVPIYVRGCAPTLVPSMTFAELLSDLRYLRDHDLVWHRVLDDGGVTIVGLGLALRIGERLRVTDAGFGVLEACADVVLPEELR